MSARKPGPLEVEWPHMPLHEEIHDAGQILVRPVCRCGWSRSALYQKDSHLLDAAYSVHLSAVRATTENRQAIRLAQKEGEK